MYFTKKLLFFILSQNEQIWKLESYTENWKYIFDLTQEEGKSEMMNHTQFLMAFIFLMLFSFNWLMIQYQ